MAALVLTCGADGGWRPSGACTDLETDGRFWDIYHSAFPPEEKEPDGVILATARDPMGLVLVFRAAASGSVRETAGLCTIQFLPSISAAFLVYLAVDPEIRGAGLGGGVLRALMAPGLFAAAGLPEPRHRILEAEAPRFAEDGVSLRVRERRLAFFGRAGLVPLYGDYFQPPLAQGAKALPMLLLAQKSDPPDAPAAVAAIYREKYQRVNGLDPLILCGLYRKSFGEEMP